MANDIAQNVIKNVIDAEFFRVSTKLLQQVDRCDDASTRTAYARLWSAGLHTACSFETEFDNIIKIQIFA